MKKIIFCFLILALSAFSFSCESSENEIVYDTETNPANETLHSEISISWADVIYYNGGEYQNVDCDIVVAGEKLGVVKYNIIDFHNCGKTTPSDGISATFLKNGTEVHACEGYSPEFRICAKSISSFAIYERIDIDEESDVSFSEMIPERNMVEKLLIITTNKYHPVGEIDKTEDIDAFWNLLKKCKFTDQKVSAANQPKYEFKIKIIFSDGSETSFGVFDDGIAYFKGRVEIPEELYSLAIKNTFAAVRDLEKHKGSFYLGEDFIFEGNDSDVIYERASMWIADGKLKMSGGINDEHMIITDNAKGQLANENNDFWYLTNEGNVAYIFCDGQKKKKEGKEVYECFTEPTVLYEGDYVSLDVYDGVVYALSEDGTLYRNGKAYIQNVKEFMVHSKGVVYTDESGLHLYTDGKNSTLVSKNIDTFDIGGAYVYYSSEDEIRCIRIDGRNDKKLLDFAASSIGFVASDWYFSKSLLTISDKNGNCHVLWDESILYSLDIKADSFGVYSHKAIFVTDGIITEKHIDISDKGLWLDSDFESKIEGIIID